MHPCHRQQYATDNYQTLFNYSCSFVLFVANLLSPGVLRAQTSGLPDEGKIYDVPLYRGARSDGKLPVLDAHALQVETLCCARGNPWPKATAAPSMRLAWDDSGLLAEVSVHHPHPWEFDYIRHLFKGDSVEFFVAPHKGSRDRYMLVISPGLDPRFPQLRHCFFPDPSEEAERDVSDLTFECNRTKTADGYTMQVQLPWSNLHIQPAMGMELSLQLYVMEAEPNRMPVVAMWNPVGESYLDSYATQRIRLAPKADAPVLACATAQDDDEQGMRTIRMVAAGAEAGKPFRLKSDEGGAIYGTLAKYQTQSSATLSVPLGQQCSLCIDSAQVPITLIPPRDNLATIMSQKLRCQFRSCLFEGDQFPRPSIDGVQHYRVAKVIYYDAAYKPVNSANNPGRYGAVIEIADGKGNVTRRFRTLFRVPDRLGPWDARTNGLLALPDLLASDTDAMKIAPMDVAGRPDLSFLNRDDALANPDTAALGACLFDHPTASESNDEWTDFRSVDRQWWVGLKRMLNGWDRQFPGPFTCPTAMVGAPAPVLQAGTDEAAGVKAHRVAELDRICQSITSDIGEPVAICLARHGVIFFHQAYGQIAGRPFTVDDPCDIQSATKPLGGTLMMEVTSSNLIHLDEPIDRIIPSFRGIAVKRPLVIRDLYDHLSGLSGDWGDPLHDTDEIIAGYYAVLDVGNYTYNEVGFALGGKVIEAVSGEAFPNFARHHLLIPLGMDHTRITHSGGHNTTTALDYAKLGQLLLNRGAYGSLRFFSEQSFRQMLPSTDGSNRRGIGLMWMPLQKYGFSASTFGHNAGNSSILAVDPVHDLVLVIASGGARKDFAQRAGAFYSAVINALN